MGDDVATVPDALFKKFCVNWVVACWSAIFCLGGVQALKTRIVRQLHLGNALRKIAERAVERQLRIEAVHEPGGPVKERSETLLGNDERIAADLWNIRKDHKEQDCGRELAEHVPARAQERDLDPIPHCVRAQKNAPTRA